MHYECSKSLLFVHSELSVTEKIWGLIQQLVSAIAEFFSADFDEILTNIIYENKVIPLLNRCSRFNSTVRSGSRFINYDPSQDIKNCRCPVMAVGGDRDCQVISSINLPGTVTTRFLSI